MIQILHRIHAFVWSPGMLVFFLATGIRFTIESGFFPLTHGKQWFLATFGSLFLKKETRKTEEPHAVSQFQSFCTALAATLGTGNITGVAAAIMTGGPGAVFWMWVSAFLGMMTNYAENYLGIRYRYKDRNGQWVGGAMVYMDRGLSCRWLAVCFSFCGIGAACGMGNMVQGNAMAKGLESAFHISPVLTGIAATGAVAYVLMGGMKRIAAWTEKLVPVMAVLYLSAAVFVLAMHRERIGWAFLCMVTEAFHPGAMCGGIAGYTVGKTLQTGVARGIFSNEAGLGSSVIAHAQSDVKNPEIQGMWGIAEIFADTMIVCTVTALVILVSGVYDPACGFLSIDGTTLTGRAFSTVIPFGEQILACATLLFAFATIIGWSCFGERTAAYLGGRKGAAAYKMIYIFLTFPGCVMTPGIIWELSDTLNGLMAIPNLIALFFLGKEIVYPQKFRE